MYPKDKKSPPQALISSSFLWSWHRCELTDAPCENGVATDVILASQRLPALCTSPSSISLSPLDVFRDSFSLSTN